MKQILKITYPETWVFMVTFSLSLFATDKIYFMLLAISLFLYLKFSRNLLTSLWLLYISAMSLLRTMPFELYFFSHKLNFNLYSNWYYSDLIFALIFYLLLTRFKKIRKKLLYKDTRSAISGFFLLLFLIAASYSTINASNPTISFPFYLTFVRSTVLYFVSKLVFLDTSLIKKTMQIIVAYVLINSLLIVAQYIIGGPLGFDFEDVSMPFGKYAENYLFRPGGLSSDPNISASFIAAVLPIAVVMFLPLAKKAAGFYLPFLTSFFLGLIFTASRASWAITVLISLPLLFYLKSKGKISLTDKFKKILKVELILLILLIGPFILSRILSLGQAFSSVGSANYRLEQAKVGLRVMLNNPFGIGLGMYPYEATKYVYEEDSLVTFDLPHNLLVQLGTESGIVGLFAFLLFLYFLYKEKLRTNMLSPNLFSNAILLSFVSINLLMLAYPWFLHPRINWLFWLLAGYPDKWKE